MKKSKFLLSFFMVLNFSFAVFSQNSEENELYLSTDDSQEDVSGSPLPANEKSLSHAQVAATAFVPYLTTLSGIGVRFMFPEDYRQYVMAGFSAASDIPSCIIHPAYSIPMTILGSAMMAGSSYFEDDYDVYTLQYKSLSSAGHFGMDMNMYTAYHGYAEARKSGPQELYQNKESYGFKELLFAPFEPAVLSKPCVYAPVIFYTAFVMISNSLNGLDESVFKTKCGYFGSKKVNALAGFAGLFAFSLLDYAVTGVGEEALFRGTGYEEAKVSWGIIPAKITDSICFSAAHVPQDIFIEEKSAGGVFGAFVSRAITGLILQEIYDLGGLKCSTAVHMWIDTAITMAEYLFNCGVQNDYSFTLKFKVEF